MGEKKLRSLLETKIKFYNKFRAEIIEFLKTCSGNNSKLTEKNPVISRLIKLIEAKKKIADEFELNFFMDRKNYYESSLSMLEHIIGNIWHDLHIMGIESLYELDHEKLKAFLSRCLADNDLLCSLLQ